MGATLWRFNADLCELEMVGISPTPPSGSEGYVECNCNFENNSLCHVTKIVIKSYNLPGILSPGIMKLPYLDYFLVRSSKGKLPIRRIDRFDVVGQQGERNFMAAEVSLKWDE